MKLVPCRYFLSCPHPHEQHCVPEKTKIPILMLSSNRPSIYWDPVRSQSYLGRLPFFLILSIHGLLQRTLTLPCQSHIIVSLPFSSSTFTSHLYSVAFFMTCPSIPSKERDSHQNQEDCDRTAGHVIKIYIQSRLALRILAQSHFPTKTKENIPYQTKRQRKKGMDDSVFDDMTRRYFFSTTCVSRSPRVFSQKSSSSVPASFPFPEINGAWRNDGSLFRKPPTYN